MLVGGIYFAQNSFGIKQKQSQLKKLETEVKNLEKQIKKAQKGQQDNLSRYNSLQKLVETRRAYIDELTRELGGLETNLTESEELIEALQRDVDSLKTGYADMVYASEKMSFSCNRLFLVFSSKSYNDLAIRLKFVNQFITIKRRQVEKIEVVQRTLSSEKQSISLKYHEKKSSLIRLMQEKAKLNSEMELANQEFERLEKREQDLASQRKQKQREIQMIKEAIAEMLKKPQQNAVVLSKGFSANKGKLPWPVKTGKSLDWRYGVQAHPSIPGVEVNNLGIGINAADGTAVYAAFGGEVRKILNIPGSGQTVMVKHGDYFTVYGRLKNVTVSAGTKVITGQQLGQVMEVSGSSSLDFQVWYKQENQNPQSWLSK
jgi:septal ring factor EnvC (AmiA/AmiB activator)